jgi:hypothetical protein
LSRELRFPDDFEDYAWEVEAKGVFWGAVVQTDTGAISPTFYDPVRLAHDIASDLASGSAVGIRHLVVIEKVTIESIQKAIRDLPTEFFT